MQMQDYPREGQALALQEAPVVRARLSANSLERKQDSQDFQDFQDEGICASEGFLGETQDYPREGQALALQEGAEKLTTPFFSSFLYSPVPVGENEGMNYSLSCSRRR